MSYTPPISTGCVWNFFNGRYVPPLSTSCNFDFGLGGGVFGPDTETRRRFFIGLE
jgi:hypothetical protein